MKKLIFFLIILTLIITGCENVGLNKLEKIEKEGEVYVGVFKKYDPFYFDDAIGDFHGFAPEVLKSVFDKINVKVKFRDYSNLEKAKEDLKTGDIKILLANKEIKDAEIVKTPPYFDNSYYLIVSKNINQRIMNLSDLQNKTIGIRQLENGVNEKLMNAGINLYPSCCTNIIWESFFNGSIDGVAVNRELSLLLKNNFPSLGNFVPISLNEEKLSFYIHKEKNVDDAFYGFLNIEVISFKREPKFMELVKQYFYKTIDQSKANYMNMKAEKDRIRSYDDDSSSSNDVDENGLIPIR